MWVEDRVPGDHKKGVRFRSCCLLSKSSRKVRFHDKFIILYTDYQYVYHCDMVWYGV
jgi:hypothetical protein